MTKYLYHPVRPGGPPCFHPSIHTTVNCELELQSSEQCLCCNRAVEQARQQLTSSFASERDTLLKEVQLTRQQQQQALAQAHTGDSHCVT